MQQVFPGHLFTERNVLHAGNTMVNVTDVVLATHGPYKEWSKLK